MKAIEFESHINPDQTVTIPARLAALLPAAQSVRVLLLVPETDDDQWESVAAEDFLQGYAESDAIYDQLPAG